MVREWRSEAPAFPAGEALGELSAVLEDGSGGGREWPRGHSSKQAWRSLNRLAFSCQDADGFRLSYLGGGGAPAVCARVASVAIIFDKWLICLITHFWEEHCLNLWKPQPSPYPLRVSSLCAVFSFSWRLGTLQPHEAAALEGLIPKATPTAGAETVSWTHTEPGRGAPALSVRSPRVREGAALG